MQNHYTLIYREEEREMIPLLKVRVRHDCDTALILRFPRLGVGCIPWSLPVRGGLTWP